MPKRDVAQAIVAANHREVVYFSHLTHKRMRQQGNDSYCFACGGEWGFTRGPDGSVTNSRDPKTGYDSMKKHDLVKHASAVVGGAGNYRTASEWHDGQILQKKNFPYKVVITH